MADQPGTASARGDSGIHRLLRDRSNRFGGLGGGLEPNHRIEQLQERTGQFHSAVARRQTEAWPSAVDQVGMSYGIVCQGNVAFPEMHITFGETALKEKRKFLSRMRMSGHCRSGPDPEQRHLEIV